MKVKFCGITNVEDAEAAVELGVDALGFIFYPPSPRFIELAVAAEVISALSLPPFLVRVAVTVNASDDEISAICTSGSFDCIQLHGDETPERCRQIEALCGSQIRLIKAVGVPVASGVELDQYPVSGLLLDKASVKRGGTGETIDWAQAAAICGSMATPVILSGGLNKDNIRKAVEVVQPYGIDVCSGIEQSPGRKDHQKMKELMQQCQ
jgi:phosphoribosylanthranilate isomerase